MTDRTPHDAPAPHDAAPEIRLAPDQLAELADLVAARVLAASTPTATARDLVTADVVAQAIGMTAGWVREHGTDLGGQRMGTGPRPRWRFDLIVALSAWASRSEGERTLLTDPLPQQAPRRRRPTTPGTDAELLPVRGEQGGLRAA